MAKKRLRAKDLADAVKYHYSLQEVAEMYGVEVDKLYQFFTQCGIAPKAAKYYIGQYKKNKGCSNIKKKNDTVEEMESVVEEFNEILEEKTEVLAENSMQEEIEEQLPIQEELEEMIEKFKSELELTNVDDSSEIIEKGQMLVLELGIRSEELEKEYKNMFGEADSIYDEIKKYLDKSRCLKEQLKNIRTKCADIQKEILRNKDIISELELLISNREEAYKNANTIVLVVDEKFDLSTIEYSSELHLTDFTANDEKFKCICKKLFELEYAGELSVKKVKTYAKVILVLEEYDSLKTSQRLILGMDEKDKMELQKIRDLIA